MHGAYLIVGENEQKRVSKIESLISDQVAKSRPSKKDTLTSPDIKNIDILEGKRSIGIDQVKEGIKFLQEKPFELKNRFLVVKNAGKMTVEAQNCLLKTLEESPGDSVILLSAENEASVLETVVSRCRRMALGVLSYEKPADMPSFGDMLKASTGEKLAYAEEISKSEREDIVQFLNYCISEQRKSLASSASAAENIKLLAKIRTDIETTNIGVRTALDLLMLKLK